jgi:hypothetical protein
MADTFLRLIPEDPQLVPSATARERAAIILRRALPLAEDVANLVTQDVRFVDCGDNFERVACAYCGADLGEWWTLAMELGHEGRFRDLRATTPCCGRRTTLNALAYSWPVGFARFTLEVLNPGLDSLPDRIHQRLEDVLACRLRLIWAHY